MGCKFYQNFYFSSNFTRSILWKIITRALPVDSEAVTQDSLGIYGWTQESLVLEFVPKRFIAPFVPKLIFRKIFLNDMARIDWNRLVLIKNEISDGNQRNPRYLDGILAESFSDMVNQNVAVFTYKNLTKLSIRKSKKYSSVLLPGLWDCRVLKYSSFGVVSFLEIYS